MIENFRAIIASLAGALFVCSCAESPSVSMAERPQKWAQPVSVAGVPNLHRVSEELYRSAQPTASGMQELEKRGIRTVINLRAFSDDEDELVGTKMLGQEIPILTWNPSSEDDDTFLRILQESPKPALVHCKHGSDRTGAMIAIYRIREQGWSVEEALSEMVSGGFGFHQIWQNLPKWVRLETQ